MDVIAAKRVPLIGDFHVRRALPRIRRRSVGPFVFLDHMGPATVPVGGGLDVPPHPHVGLSTLTYLFEGSVVHRDSLGITQTIRPGDVNWMTAGRGIVHSERADPTARGRPRRSHGLQAWVGLPRDREDDPPSFTHHPAETIPVVAREGLRATIVAGTALGERSPVPVVSDLFYVDLRLEPGAEVTIELPDREGAVYVVEGACRSGAERLGPGHLLVAREGAETMILRAPPDATLHAVALGGAPLDGPRFLLWNFVASDKRRLERAAADWRAHRFPTIPGDDRERVEMP